MENQEYIISKLQNSLPAIFGRTAVEKLMPGILNSKTLANLDSAGEGPPYFKQGRKVFYERDSFLKWFEKRVIKAVTQDD